jgi:hypothetical protein
MRRGARQIKPGRGASSIRGVLLEKALGRGQTSCAYNISSGDLDGSYPFLITSVRVQAPKATANCEKARSFSVYDRCKAKYEGL